MKSTWNQFEQDNIETVSSDPWRLTYHLMPPVGWLNDPNGLCEHKGTTHIFYQYSPLDANGAKKGWGHYTTTDWKTFSQCPIELVPDQEIDRDGVYSGSAFEKDGTVHFFYTGNIKFEGEHDYIYEGRGHYVNTFTLLEDGTVSERKNVLRNEDYPDDLSCHVRDPKVFEEDGVYYMVLGARTKEDVGQILVYRSDDLEAWTYHGRIQSGSAFGYMWECPDLFELDGQKVLMTCPQGVEQQGLKYENIYQNGYFLLDGKMKEGTEIVAPFAEFDHGFDFYAPQTYRDEKGRRILIGWMGLPDTDYANPTVERGWQHALTLPRELTFSNGKVFQFPIKEVLDLSCDERNIELQAGHVFEAEGPCFHATLFPEGPFSIGLRQDAELNYDGKVLSFALKDSGYGRDVRHIVVEDVHSIDVFSDTSSVEIFVNGGEHALTSRIYDAMTSNRIVSDTDMDMTIRAMGSYCIERGGEKE
ncbi:glycoside hydrolase family 32 protein [uncultured Dubosiella sp.]|uniref:glycoside hydrolase family 32 protein n=2 Tax=uncultured Dubosiella sp. TaxID=1937011 RepID=UPI0026302379|nr:glycoside hydrolase family 32 protein [uncultured Dubosiella sp.]